MNLADLVKEYKELMQVAIQTSDQELFNKARKVVLSLTDKLFPEEEASEPVEKEEVEKAEVLD